MRELLSKTANRRVTILEQLNLAHGWQSVPKLAEIANCTNKTVHQDVQFLADNWSNYLSIETSKSKGIRLFSPPGNTIRTIYSDIIQESEAFSFMEQLFFTPQQTAEYWREQMFFSESTLYRISNHMDHSLARRGIYMERNPYLISSHDERHTRFFFTELFLEIYGVHQWPFDINQQGIIMFIKSILTALDMNLNDGTILHLCYLLAVSLIRKSQGFYLNPSMMKYRDDKLQIFLCQHQQDLEKIIEPFEWQLSPTWFEDISYTLFFYFYSWDNDNEEKRIREHILQSITTIQTALDLPITDEDRKRIMDVMVFSYTRYKVYPYPEFVLYDQYAFNSDSIKQNYLTYSAVTTKVLKILEKNTKFPWFSALGDVLLYWIMVQWKDLPIYLDQKRKRVSVLVISDLGGEHAQLVGSLVNKNFSDRINLRINESSLLSVPFEQVYSEKEIDLVISNFSLEDFQVGDSVVVDPIPTLRNWNDIRRAIEKHRLVLPSEIPFLRN